MVKKNYNDCLIFGYLFLDEIDLFKRKDFVNMYTFCQDIPKDDCICLMFEQTGIMEYISLEEDLKKCPTFYKMYNVSISDKWYTLVFFKVKSEYIRLYKGIDYEKELNAQIPQDVFMKMLDFTKDVNSSIKFSELENFFVETPFLDDNESVISSFFLEEDE